MERGDLLPVWLDLQGFQPVVLAVPVSSPRGDARWGYSWCERCVNCRQRL
jgi:hypothetical protein